ncbi:MAG: helix-turn-helix domain-containing protein [Eubacterium sp.]|jgi:plasmid maintenance system antidote protein VapI
MGATYRDYDRIKTGAKIKNLLAAKRGVSAMELAEELDISDTSVKNILNGRRGMSADTLFHIAQYFGVSVDYLMDPEAPDIYESGEGADEGKNAPAAEQSNYFRDGRRGYAETERGRLIKEIAACADQLDLENLKCMAEIAERIRDIYLKR